MTVYEDDPRRRPKRQSYGGSSNRSAAKRGELRESTGSVSWESGQRRKNAEQAQRDWERGGTGGSAGMGWGASAGAGSGAAPSKPMEIPRRDPRLTPSPRSPGPDRSEWGRLPWRLRSDQPLDKGEYWTDAVLHKLTEALSPGAALLERFDASRNPSRPSLDDRLRAWKLSNQRMPFYGGDKDEGIYVTPPAGTKPEQPPVYRFGRLPKWSGKT